MKQTTHHLHWKSQRRRSTEYGRGGEGATLTSRNSSAKNCDSSALLLVDFRRVCTRTVRCYFFRHAFGSGLWKDTAVTVGTQQRRETRETESRPQNHWFTSFCIFTSRYAIDSAKFSKSLRQLTQPNQITFVLHSLRKIKAHNSGDYHTLLPNQRFFLLPFFTNDTGTSQNNL